MPSTDSARPRAIGRLALVTLTSGAVILTGSRASSARPLADEQASVLADTTAPSQPTGLAAVPATYGVELTWKASTDDVGVAYYLVTVGTQTRQPKETRAFVGQLAASTDYTATVRAVDAAGNKSAPATLTFRTLPPADTQAPTAPTGLTATPYTNGVGLAWTAATDNIGVKNYVVTLAGQTKTLTGTSTYLGGLAPSTVYTARVQAVDTAGNVSAATKITFTTRPSSGGGDTQAPTAPTNLKATPASTSLALSWTAATDNVAVTAYTVTVGSQSLTVTGTSATVTGLTPSTAYSVSVKALDAAGNASPAATLSVTTLAAPDTQAPTAPTNLKATPATTSAALTWTAATDNVAVTAYTVTVGTQKLTVTGTSATISGLTPATAYTATVTASDLAGNVSPATSVAFTTAALPTGPSIYVSPTGSDTAAGSATAPLRSVQLAVDRATPGTTIRLYAGTYRNDKTIRIRNSGTASAPITITPAGNGPVLLDHPVATMSCSNSRPAPDRTITINDGADYWTIQGLSINNGIWLAGKRSNNAYNWITNYVNAGNWSARRAAPGHGVYDPAAARTALVPFLRTVTGHGDLDMVEGITIANNHLTGRGVYGALTSYGRITGNTIDKIPCGIGPGIWLMTFSNGWTISGNDVSDIAISSAAHFMQEGIRIGSAANYNEITGNTVHDLPGDGRGINTDVDASWNYIHHNTVRNVAIGYNDQMSGWGNRWEYNTVDGYRVYGIGFRLKDATLSAPSLHSSSYKSVARCNVAIHPLTEKSKALGVGAMMNGTFAGNNLPKLWLSKNLKTYWSAQANTWNGSSAVPPDAPPYVPTGC